MAAVCLAASILSLLAAPRASAEPNSADCSTPRRAVETWLDNAHDNPSIAGACFEFTGTGFPLVFYLRYHMYRIYFPLLALTDWRQALSRDT